MITTEKIGSALMFTKDGTGEQLKYSFADKKFYLRKGGTFKVTYNGQAFFRKMPAETLLSGFKDEAYKKLVRDILRGERRCRNIATLLERLGGYQHLEGYYLLGIRLRDSSYYMPTRPISDYPKEVIAFFRDLCREGGTNTLDIKTFETYYWQTPEIFHNLITYVRTNYRDDFEAYEFAWSIVATHAYFWQKLSTPVNQKFSRGVYYNDEFGMGCEYKTLFDYVVRVNRQEAMDLARILTYYRDYLSQSGEMEKAKYIRKCALAGITVSQDDAKSYGYGRVEKYPRFLSTRHDIVAKNYRAISDQVDETIFAAMVNKELAYQWGKYKVIVPATAQDVKDEGTNLHHCVAGYVKRILNGGTQIVFMRENPEESLITLEIRAGAIQQARGYGNRSTTDEERTWLKTYAKAKGLELPTCW